MSGGKVKSVTRFKKKIFLLKNKAQSTGFSD